MIDHASALFALFPRLKRFEIFILSVAGPEQLFQSEGPKIMKHLTLPWLVLLNKNEIDTL